MDDERPVRRKHDFLFVNGIARLAVVVGLLVVVGVVYLVQR